MVPMRWAPTLLARIDAQAEKAGVDRSTFIRQACLDKLSRES